MTAGADLNVMEVAICYDHWLISPKFLKILSAIIYHLYNREVDRDIHFELKNVLKTLEWC